MNAVKYNRKNKTQMSLAFECANNTLDFISIFFRRRFAIACGRTASNGFCMCYHGKTQSHLQKKKETRC